MVVRSWSSAILRHYPKPDPASQARKMPQIQARQQLDVIRPDRVE